MHLGETVKVIKAWNLIIILLAYIPAAAIASGKWRKVVREKLDLLREDDPGAFREAFRRYVLEKTSVKGYVEGVYPFRIEPLEDSFLLDRFVVLEVWGSRTAAAELVIVAMAITVGMAFMEYALTCLGGFGKALPVMVYLTVMSVLLPASSFLAASSVLRLHRLNRALAEKFAKGSED